MDKYFGQWYRETKMPVKHDVLTRRWEGVENFAKNLTSDQIFELSRLFYQMNLNEKIFEEDFRTAFQGVDSAFLMSGNDLELAVLAGATLREAVKKDNKTISVISAFATVCPSFSGNGNKPAVPDIVLQTRKHLAQKSAALRRLEGAKRILFPSQELGDASENLAKLLKSSDLPNAADKSLAYFRKFTSTLQKCVEFMNQIQREHLLHREESDILWWVMGEHSRDLNVPIRTLELPVACLVAGKELADLTRILPGPFAAPAFLDKFLRNVSPDLDKQVSFSEGVTKADNGWREKWSQDFHDIEALDLCPTLFAIRRSTEETGDEKAWERPFEFTTKVSAKVHLYPVDIALQVYEECLFVRSVKNVRPKK